MGLGPECIGLLSDDARRARVAAIISSDSDEPTSRSFSSHSQEDNHGQGFPKGDFSKK